MASAKNALVYKGHPLRRKDNILYYGSMSDKYIIMMQIMDTKPVKPVAGAESAGELKVATRVGRISMKGMLLALHNMNCPSASGPLVLVCVTRISFATISLVESSRMM